MPKKSGAKRKKICYVKGIVNISEDSITFSTDKEDITIMKETFEVILEKTIYDRLNGGDILLIASLFENLLSNNEHGAVRLIHTRFDGCKLECTKRAVQKNRQKTTIHCSKENTGNEKGEISRKKGIKRMLCLKKGVGHVMSK